MKKILDILLVGDSWGYNWLPTSHLKSKEVKNLSQNPSTDVYVGFNTTERLLNSIGHSTKNYFQPGASNRTIINNLANLDHSIKYDLIVWLKTDPVRDLFNYAKDGIEENCKPVSIKFQTFTKTEFISWHKTQSLNTYKAINQSSHDYFNGIPVLCFGGACRLHGELFDNISYPNYPSVCHIGTESLIEHCCKLSQEQTLVKQGLTTSCNWVSFMDYEKWNPELVEFIHQDSKLQEKINFNSHQYLNWFSPDYYHGNANTSYVLADLIQDFIENNF